MRDQVIRLPFLFGSFSLGQAKKKEHLSLIIYIHFCQHIKTAVDYHLVKILLEKEKGLPVIG